jgi:hypothetical protein
LTSDFFRDGLDLFWVAAGGDYKKIGEGGDIAQIEHSDVGRFLRFSSADGDKPMRGGERFGELLSGGVTWVGYSSMNLLPVWYTENTNATITGCSFVSWLAGSFR